MIVLITDYSASQFSTMVVVVEIVFSAIVSSLSLTS